MTTENSIEPLEKEVVTVVDVAKKLVIRNDADKEGVMLMGRDWKARIKFAEDFFRPDIQKAHELHKSLTGKLKSIIDPYKQAIQTVKTSIGTFDNDKAEKARQAALKLQQEETDKHNRAIKAAQKKIGKLLEGTQDAQICMHLLNEKLEAGDCSEEEAEVMRNQIEIYETAIKNNQEKADVVVEKVEEKAPAPTYIPPDVVAKNWTATVSDPKALCRAIAEGKVGVGAVKAWNTTLLQAKKKNGEECPGVTYTPDYGKGKRL